MTELELAAWDAVWQRFYDRGGAVGDDTEPVGS